MVPLFAVSVHDIDAGGLVRSFEVPLAWLERVLDDTDVSATEAGHADVRLSRTGHDVVVRGKVKATLSQPCARCLRPTTAAVEGELSLLLRPAKSEASTATSGSLSRAPKHAAKKEGPRGNGPKQKPRDVRQSVPRDEEEYEFSSEEADHDAYDGETVVLDPFLREALLLELPSFPLCSEDCPGIRPTPRAAPQREEPIDPRLSPLQALKIRMMVASGPEGKEGAPAAKAPRPKIQAHRTTRPRSKAKSSPQKKAKS